MAKQKSPKRNSQISEEELRRRHDRFVLVFERLSSLVTKALYGATVVAFAYVTFYLPLTVAPGETTVVKNLTHFVSNIRANIAVAWTVACGATLWAYRERKLRLDERKTKDERIRSLERVIDPGVTSSRMDVAGTGVVGG